MLALGSIGILVPLAGCGAQRIEEGRAEVPARVTASADPSLSNVRPLPEVIPKPRPFRLPEVIARVPSLEPVTMTPAIATGVAPAAAPAALEFPADRPAVAEVAAMFRDYLTAFNRHDAAALAAHWSETAENVDLDSGETTRGREAVGEVFTALFAEDDGATFDIDVESIRPVSADVVLVDGVSRISFTDGSPHASAADSRFSAVVVKQDGRWLLESVRALAPAAQPAAGAAAGTAATAGNGLPPPPPQEPWIEELGQLQGGAAGGGGSPLRVPLNGPLNSPPPEPSPAAAGGGGTAAAAGGGAAPLPELLGVVQIPGKPGSAIFQVGGSSTNALVGEAIGGSGWRLQSTASDSAVIERGGVSRRISISSGF